MTKQKMQAFDVADWIANTQPERKVRCMACLEPKVAHAIATFAKARESGKTQIPWRQFYKKCLVDIVGFKGGESAFMSHVRNCLGCKA